MGQLAADGVVHRSRVLARRHERGEWRFDIECDVCGQIGAVDTREQADVIVYLHEQFVAVLVDKWEVPS